MPRLLRQKLLGLRRQSCRTLVFDLVLRDDRGLLWLDDTGAALRAGVGGPDESVSMVGREDLVCRSDKQALAEDRWGRLTFSSLWAWIFLLRLEPS